MNQSAFVFSLCHLMQSILQDGRWRLFVARAAGFVVVVTALTAVPFCESRAQIVPLLRVKIDVSASVGVSQVQPGVQILIQEELEHLKELVAVRSGGAESLNLTSGFSISAFENIRVLVSIATPGRTVDANDSTSSLRLSCCYLNDGTTYFCRATITDTSAAQFRLRNVNLLKRSMKLENPLFVAYVFFLVEHQKGIAQDIDQSPVPVTIEFL